MFLDGDHGVCIFIFFDLVDYLMGFMVNRKRTRAKIAVEPEKRSLFCESSSSIST